MAYILGSLLMTIGAAISLLGTITFFVYQGPGGLVAPVVPLIGNLAAGICFLLAFPVIGLRLWQGDAARD